MGKISPFDFLNNRIAKRELTEEEMDGFDYWSTLVAMSMSKDKKMPKILGLMNRLGFSRLPKRIQARCLTQFDGGNLTGKWQKQKQSSNNIKKEYIEKICKLLDCSQNEAKSYIEHNIYNENDINELYERMYEPEKVKFRKHK